MFSYICCKIIQDATKSQKYSETDSKRGGTDELLLGKRRSFCSRITGILSGTKAPHFNTLSTIVRGLEEKGFLDHKSYGNTYQYYPVISQEDYKNGALSNVVSKYFKNSYLGVVSSLIEEERISVEELKKLIEKVEKLSKSS